MKKTTTRMGWWQRWLRTLKIKKNIAQAQTQTHQKKSHTKSSRPIKLPNINFIFIVSLVITHRTPHTELHFQMEWVIGVGIRTCSIPVHANSAHLILNQYIKIVKSLKENVEIEREKSSYTNNSKHWSCGSQALQRLCFNINNNISTFVIYIDLVDLQWSYAIAQSQSMQFRASSVYSIKFTTAPFHDYLFFLHHPFD